MLLCWKSGGPEAATTNRQPDRLQNPTGQKPHLLSTGGQALPTPDRRQAEEELSASRSGWGADGQAPAKIGPGHYGQPGKQVVGVAHQKPVKPSSGDRLEHQAVCQVENPCQQDQGKIQASHRKDKIKIAHMTPRMTAATVALKDMPCSVSGL